MLKIQKFIAEYIFIILISLSLFSFSPQVYTTPAFLTSAVTERMAVVHKRPDDQFKHYVVLLDCGTYNCREI
jgi:hypothetical protein